MSNLYDEYLQLQHDFSQKCASNSYDLRYVWEQMKKGYINLDMDMQRKYVWTNAQEQELFDTLLLQVRIPEFHALVENDLKWQVCDGRQRFTCLFNILDDKIPLKRSMANERLQFLFEYKMAQKGLSKLPNEVFFSEFPADTQGMILNTQITVAKYSNLTRQEQILLFRKINNGTALSSLAKGLASYYYMRTDYSELILEMPQFSKTSFTKVKQEELEGAIIRMLLLISSPTNRDLQQQSLEKYYHEFENINYLVAQREKVIDTINKIPGIERIIKNQSWKTIFPFIIEGFYNHSELTPDQIEKIFVDIIENFSSGRGNDLSASGVTKRRAVIENYIKKYK